MAIIRNAKGSPLYPVGKMKVSEDTSFVAGDSPVVIDVNDALGVNGDNGYIVVDGAGDILVEISHVGTSYLSQFTMKSGEVFSLQGMDVDTIRLTHSGTDSKYRVNAF